MNKIRGEVGILIHPLTASWRGLISSLTYDVGGLVAPSYARDAGGTSLSATWGFIGHHTGSDDPTHLKGGFYPPSEAINILVELHMFLTDGAVHSNAEYERNTTPEGSMPCAPWLQGQID